MKRLCVLFALGCMLAATALADGQGEWVKSSFNGYVQFASFVGDYDGWIDIDGKGGVTPREQANLRVVSKNASVWSEPRTNSKKLGTVNNGDDIWAVPANVYDPEIQPIVEQNGFYAVDYNGKRGWINSTYVVHAPFELVLMESNVPAFCAPDRSSKRVGSLSKLTRYTVIGFYEDFYVVNLRQAAAFIPMSVKHYDTHFERWHHAGVHGNLFVRSKTEIRTGPGDDYAKVKDAKVGQQYDCIDEIDGWYLITDGDNGGYTYIWSGDAEVSWM